jgi:hypothetical protein
VRRGQADRVGQQVTDGSAERVVIADQMQAVGYVVPETQSI